MTYYNDMNQMLKELEIAYKNSNNNNNNNNTPDIYSTSYKQNDIAVKKNIETLILEQNRMNDKLNNFYFDNKPFINKNSINKNNYGNIVPQNSNIQNELLFNKTQEPKSEINDRLQKLNQNYINDIGNNIKSNYSNNYLENGKLSISEPSKNTTKQYNYDIMNQRMAKLNPMGRNIQTPVELEIKANLYNLPNSKKKFKDVYYEKIQQLSPLPNVANTSIDPYKNAFLNINPIDSRNTDQ